MKLSPKAQKALNKVVDQFKTGDLSGLVTVIRTEVDPKSPCVNWSIGNRTLAYMQTGTLDCRTYKQWQSVGRQVQGGMSASFLWRPNKYKRTDEETGEEKTYMYGFKPFAVHPYSSTEGEPLDISYEPREVPPLMDVAKKLGLQVQWGPMLTALGSCRGGHTLNLGSQDIEVFFHELAHAAHYKVNGWLKGGQDPMQETVAEFTATVLMHLYNLGDRTGNAWQYIRQYATDPIQAVSKALASIEDVLSLILETEAV